MPKEIQNTQNPNTPNHKKGSRALKALAPIVAAVALYAVVDSGKSNGISPTEFDSPKTAIDNLNKDVEPTNSETIAELKGAVDVTKQDTISRVQSIKDSINLEKDEYRRIVMDNGSIVGLEERMGKDGETITSLYLSKDGYLQAEMSVAENTDGTKSVLYQEHETDGGTRYSRFEAGGSFSNFDESFIVQDDGSFSVYSTSRIILEADRLSGTTSYADSPGTLMIMETDEINYGVAGSLQAVTDFVDAIEAAKISASI